MGSFSSSPSSFYSSKRFKNYSSSNGIEDSTTSTLASKKRRTHPNCIDNGAIGMETEKEVVDEIMFNISQYLCTFDDEGHESGILKVSEKNQHMTVVSLNDENYLCQIIPGEPYVTQQAAKFFFHQNMAEV